VGTNCWHFTAVSTFMLKGSSGGRVGNGGRAMRYQRKDSKDFMPKQVWPPRKSNGDFIHKKKVYGDKAPTDYDKRSEVVTGKSARSETNHRKIGVFCAKELEP